MASILGSEGVTMQSGPADPTPVNIDIPVGTDAVYVFWSFYAVGAGHAIASATLNSVASDFDIDANNGSGYSGHGVVVFFNPATGTKSLDLEWTVSPKSGEGPCVHCIYTEGYTQTAIAADADCNAGPSTLSVDSVTSDTVIRCEAQYASTPASETGYTTIIASAINGYGQRIETKDSVSTETVTINVQGGSYEALSALALRPIVVEQPKHAILRNDPRMMMPRLYKKNLKPSGRVEIDWSNPLTRGLVSYVVNDQCNNYVSSNADTVITDRGKAFSFNGSTQEIQLTPTDANYIRNSYFTIMRTSDSPSTSYKSVIWAHEQGNIHWDHNNTAFRNSANYEDSDNYQSVRYNVSVDEWQHLGFTVDDGIEVFQNGLSLGSDGSGPALSSPGARYLMSDGGGDFLSGEVLVAYYWDRPLSAAEHFSLHNDPYQFLKPAGY